MIPTSPTIQQAAFDQKACSACGRREIGISADHVRVRHYTSFIALCERCHSRAQFALRIIGAPNCHAGSTLPTMAPCRLIAKRESERQTICASPRACEGRRLSKLEILVKSIMASVAHGNRTVEQLKSNLNDGLAYVEERGLNNVNEELLLVLGALDNAIQRIELNHNRHRDN